MFASLEHLWMNHKHLHFHTFYLITNTLIQFDLKLIRSILILLRAMQDLKPLPLPDKTREDIFLFFKLYEPEKEQLRYFSYIPTHYYLSYTQYFIFRWIFIPLLDGIFRYVGRLFVKASGRPQDILPKLRMLAGFSQDDDIELYEVSLVFWKGYIANAYIVCTLFWFYLIVCL